MKQKKKVPLNNVVLLFDFCRTSQFIISVNKYMEAAKLGFTVGMRYKMRFEGEDVPEKRQV